MNMRKGLRNSLTLGLLALVGGVAGCTTTGESDERILGLMLGVQQYNENLTPQQRASAGYTGEVIQRYGVAETGKSDVTQNNYNNGQSVQTMNDAEKAVEGLGRVEWH